MWCVGDGGVMVASYEGLPGASTFQGGFLIKKTLKKSGCILLALPFCVASRQQAENAHADQFLREAFIITNISDLASRKNGRPVRSLETDQYSTRDVGTQY